MIRKQLSLVKQTEGNIKKIHWTLHLNWPIKFRIFHCFCCQNERLKGTINTGRSSLQRLRKRYCRCQHFLRGIHSFWWQFENIKNFQIFLFRVWEVQKDDVVWLFLKHRRYLWTLPWNERDIHRWVYLLVYSKIWWKFCRLIEIEIFGDFLKFKHTNLYALCSIIL